MMGDDEEVVFKNSALYNHLKVAGFSDDVMFPETLTSCNGDTADGFTHDNSQNSKSKLSFWSKLKNSVDVAFWDENWNDQLTQVHTKYGDDITDRVLESPALEEEDGLYIDSFFMSMQSYRPEPEQGETSILGTMLMQMAVLGVSLAYGGFRMIYLKSPDSTSRVYVWSIDFVAVLLTFMTLLPTTVKSACAGRVVSRLKKFNQSAKLFLKEVGDFHKLTKRSVKFIQEMELVARGFTMISPMTPVTRLEHGSMQPSVRQCPKLRRMTFHATRAVMLSVKKAGQELLRSFPSHVEIDGLSNYLANQPLSDYGPCINLQSEHSEDRLRAVTEDYSLAAIKAMVDLCNLHISEFLRILSMSLLTRAEEHKANPSFKQEDHLVGSLRNTLHEHIKPLAKLYTLHKCLNTEQDRSKKYEKHDRNPMKQTPTEALYIAIHSLSLHLQAALSRIHSVEDELEKLLDTQEENEMNSASPSTELLTQLTSDLKVIHVDINACQDCVDESQLRVDKFSQATQNPGATEKKNTDVTSTSCKAAGVNLKDPVPLFEMGDPVVQDQVFEAYTDPSDVDLGIDDGDNLLSDEERIKKKLERQEAIRLLKELKSVIAVRAVEREQREREAFFRQYPDTKFQDPISILRKSSASHHDDGDDEGGNKTFETESEEEQSRHPDKTSQEQTEYNIESHVESSEKDTDSFDDLTEACHQDKLHTIRDRLSNLGGSFPFSSDLAAMAAARSQQVIRLAEDTFDDVGDYSESSSDNEPTEDQQDLIIDINGESSNA